MKSVSGSPAELLSAEGPLADAIEGYAVRPQQQELAETIRRALDENVSLICEAGTGTGKSYAYLLPALLSGRKIIVSTGTKHLQDQLFYKDLPVVTRALDVPKQIALLKGRANYLCHHRLAETVADPDGLSGTEEAELEQVREWTTHTQSGDLAELATLPENTGLRPFITSTTENCLGQECEYYEDCFVLKARKKAIEADLVVANHHLLMADMTLRESGFGEVLPRADAIIFDEAHQLSQLAADFFGESITSRQLYDLLRDTLHSWTVDAMDVTGMDALLDECRTAMKKFRLSLGRGDLRAAWPEKTGEKKVMQTLDGLNRALGKLEQSLDELKERSRELENLWRRCSHLLDLLMSFQEREEDESVQWVETRGQGFLLHRTPLDISGLFQARLREYHCHCIYTSATLAVGEDFSHFAGQLGLQEVEARSWPGPFNFRQQALLYLPGGLPDPRTPEYTGEVVQQSLPVLAATRGHAFLLFTSHRALREASAIISDRIEYPVLVQGEAPRNDLLQRFRNTPHAVLLGTSSFWEGVDVRGQALSCVIIDKLPFATPDDPVFRARSARMEEQGINPFWHYQLPRAVISLKQGVGRLIRDVNDYGVMMICDPRLQTKSYGRKFLDSLPDMPVTRDIEDVRAFFARREG